MATGIRIGEAPSESRGRRRTGTECVVCRVNTQSSRRTVEIVFENAYTVLCSSAPLNRERLALIGTTHYALDDEDDESIARVPFEVFRPGGRS